MVMTIMSAAKDVHGLQSTNDITMQTLCKAISSGSLKGARGNSGVILSQLLRGFTKMVKESEEITVPMVADACEKAVETAYKAVMKPKEGTILTVAKGISDKARELTDAGCDDMESYLDQIIKHAEVVLAHTPDLLPILKQAGVVDSGGQGLVEILHGAYDAFLGKEISYDLEETAAEAIEEEKEESKFTYCTEYIVHLDKVFNIKHEIDFKAYLETIGESIAIVTDEEILKVHVYTNDPGLAIQRGLKYGHLTDIKVDNMKAENVESQTPAKPVELKDYGFVSVSAGDGLSEIFKGLGVDYVIEGGQTMNPSTEDFVEAIKTIPARTVFVLPNNKNIIMSANQAQYLVDDKKVIVIPTKTIPQGITAMINFMADATPEDNEACMTEEIKNVKTGQVTYSVRDTQIDDKEIKEGDYMGLGDSGLLAVNEDLKTVTCMTIDEMAKDGDVELFSIYYGAEVSEDDVNEIVSYINDKYPSCDVECNLGGQPIYYYIISAE